MKPTKIGSEIQYPTRQWSGRRFNTSWKKMDPRKLLECDRFSPGSNWVDSIEDAKKLKKSEYCRIRPKSEAWFWARGSSAHLNGTGLKKHRYGASDMANILGFFDNTSLAEKLLKPLNDEKKRKEALERGDDGSVVDLVKNEEEQDPFTKANFDWGHQHEDNAIRTLIEANPNIYVKACGGYILEEGLEDEPYDIFITPDGLFEDSQNGLSGCIEAKCRVPYYYNAKTEMFTFKSPKPFAPTPPKYYAAQYQLQMKVTGTKVCKFISYTPTGGTIIYTMKRDDLFIDLCLGVLSWAYHEYVTLGRPIPESGYAFKGCSIHKLMMERAEIITKGYVDGIDPVFIMSGLGIEPMEDDATDPLFLKDDTIVGGDLSTQQKITPISKPPPPKKKPPIRKMGPTVLTPTQKQTTVTLFSAPLEAQPSSSPPKKRKEPSPPHVEDLSSSSSSSSEDDIIVNPNKVKRKHRLVKPGENCIQIIFEHMATNDDVIDIE